jgi:hypothetical protein
MTAGVDRQIWSDRVIAMLRDWEIGRLVYASVLTICIAISPGLHTASAAPLDEESCQRLRTEKEALSVLGIDKYFEQGAAWVKANLTSADHNLVKRYVNVFEQLKFRCRTEPVKTVAAKTPKGPTVPMPVRSPKRLERTATPAKAAKPG